MPQNPKVVGCVEIWYNLDCYSKQCNLLIYRANPPPMRDRDSTFRICCKSVHFIEYFSIICHTNIGILFELSIRQVNNSANSAPHNQERCIDLWVVNPGHCVTKIEIQLHISTIVVVVYLKLITLHSLSAATLFIIFSPSLHRSFVLSAPEFCESLISVADPPMHSDFADNCHYIIYIYLYTRARATLKILPI